jgi:hypothetical protein
MTNNNGFQIISSEQLSNAAGGGIGNFFGKALKIGGKALAVASGVSDVYGGWQGAEKYRQDRAQGKGVMPSLWDGAKKALWPF